MRYFVLVKDLPKLPSGALFVTTGDNKKVYSHFGDKEWSNLELQPYEYTIEEFEKLSDYFEEITIQGDSASPEEYKKIMKLFDKYQNYSIMEVGSQKQMQFMFLYPSVMKSFDIQPENLTEEQKLLKELYEKRKKYKKDSDEELS